MSSGTDQETASAPAATQRPAETREVMIGARGLGKTFKIYAKPWARMAEWLSFGRAVRHEDFHALHDITFDLARGEALGVIGLNGSGKSTLLKILSGALYPTAGEFNVNGRVLSLLELGTGVNLELTGRQNVINSSLLLGFPADYPTRKMAEIEAFAELADFFDRPVRLYSSGMLVRLVFSMFACFDPDIFIVDEALSVGDIHFQQKCARRMREMLDRGITMLFVSHDLGAVEALCDRVMVLHGGRVRFLGDKAEGIPLYYSLVGASRPGAGNVAANQAIPARQSVADLGAIADSDFPWQPPDTSDATGNGAIVITGFRFQAPDGRPDATVERGQWLELSVLYEATADAGPVNGGISIRDRFDQLLYAVSWLNAEVEPLRMRAGERAMGRFRLCANLEPGEYTVSLGAAEALRDPENPTGWNQDLGGERYATLPRAARFSVLPRVDGRRPSFGPANLESKVEREVLPAPAGRSRLE